MPVFVANGDSDPMILPRYSHLLAGLIPQARLKIYPDSADEAEDLLPGLAYNGVARLDPRAAVRPGERVTFRVDPNRLHFFDSTTGLAIGWPRDRTPDQAGAHADSA